ncbi:hypothetical protein PV939_11090, partial [Ligilactobacillus salivarius]|nr:hypothetical protein [Ligilactobacillus salivarius]
KRGLIIQPVITIDNYEFTTDYLENATCGEKEVEETLVSHLLKSNCLITHQPDWGSLQIQYRGRQIDREKLLRYLVSFRHHNEFHEQFVERIFNCLLLSLRSRYLSLSLLPALLLSPTFPFLTTQPAARRVIPLRCSATTSHNRPLPIISTLPQRALT